MCCGKGGGRRGGRSGLIRRDQNRKTGLIRDVKPDKKKLIKKK
jgi:hypothetical protein